MKLTKINLNELSNADLNEREMCRLLGGGTPGNCQCSCAQTSTTGSNNSYNNASGLSSTTASSGTNPSYTYNSNCFYVMDGTVLTSCDGLDCDGGIVHGACTNH